MNLIFNTTKIGGINGLKLRCDECKWLQDPDDLQSYYNLFLCPECLYKLLKAK
jgi:hypothetical protein